MSIQSSSPPPYVQTAPVLGTRYDGTISNLYNSPALSATVTLTIQQSGTNIHGFFSSSLSPAQKGEYIGIVLDDNTLQFLVSGYAGLLPLLFRGKLHPDGSLSGSYCSFQNGYCNYAGGSYGKWVAYRSLDLP
jgi:hypothetical protein